MNHPHFTPTALHHHGDTRLERFVAIGRLAGPVFTGVMVVIMDATLMLVMLPVIYGTLYHIWRDISGDARVSGTKPLVAA